MSIVVRMSLGRQLKALREAAGKTPSEVAVTTIASTSKLHRVERGEVHVRLETVWALCDLYGADAATKSRLSAMALNTSENGWWETHPIVLPPRFGTYIELEAAADSLLAWDGELVHGLLQTPEYHSAIFSADPYPSDSDDDRKLQIAFRSERQRAVLERPNPLQISVVIGEGALVREVGSQRVMSDQKQHLVELAQRPNIEIRVLRWSAGAHVATKGAYTLLEYTAVEHPHVVYLETYDGGRYVEDPDRVVNYREMHQALLGAATPIQEYLR